MQPPDPSNTTHETLSLIISGLALTVSAATFVWARLQERSATRSARVKALQGEKEAVAYVAYRIRSGAWAKELESKSFREDMIAALCLAFLLEGADRPKALVFAALRRLSRHWRTDILYVLEQLHTEMLLYDKEFQPDDFSKRIGSVARLKELIEAPGVHDHEGPDGGRNTAMLLSQG